jgi:hypothetical protein
MIKINILGWIGQDNPVFLPRGLIGLIIMVIALYIIFIGFADKAS